MRSSDGTTGNAASGRPGLRARRTDPARESIDDFSDIKNLSAQDIFLFNTFLRNIYEFMTKINFVYIYQDLRKGKPKWEK